MEDGHDGACVMVSPAQVNEVAIGQFQTFSL
jgi:hypothetical protein